MILNVEKLNSADADTYYLVFGNGGCLSYDEHNTDTKYNIVSCDALDDKQHFHIDNINNVDKYNSKIANNINKVKSDDIVNMNFSVVSPRYSDKICMNTNNNILTFSECDMNSYQKYTPLYEHIN